MPLVKPEDTPVPTDPTPGKVFTLVAETGYMGMVGSELGEPEVKDDGAI